MEECYTRILDRNMLQKLQDEFCATVGVYACCVDGSGDKMTDMSCTPEEQQRLAELVQEDKLQVLFRRLAESELEEQACEDTETDGIKYAVVTVKKERKPVLAWFVYGAMSDAVSEAGQALAGQFSRQISERRFGQALDLLGEAGRCMVGNKVSEENAKAVSRQSLSSQEEMEAGLLRAATTTEIVQLLDSDEPIEQVMLSALRIMGTFLKVDSAYLCDVESEEADTINVIAEWCGEGIAPVFDKKKNQARPSYLYRLKPLILSSDGSQENYEEDLTKAGVTALAALPIRPKDKVGMYACFEQKRQARTWKIEEVKFLNDSVKILQSILAKRIQKNSLASSYVALEEILDNVGSAVYVRDKESGRILFTNRNMRRSFRRALELDQLATDFESRIPEGSNSGNVEICMKEDGFWFDLFYKDITWVDGREVLMCSIYDVTEKRMYQQKIERQAYTDFLTGLNNRMCCERDLAKYVGIAKKTDGAGAVLYMDLDDFKHINDSLGHQYGDVLLRSIAHGMQSIRGISNSCYRMGGDEFVIIIPPSHYNLLDQVVESIKMVFNKPWFLRNADYYCTMSMGIVHFPEEGEGVQELIQKADIAMYEAKKTGKNRIATYSDKIESYSNKRLDLEKNLRDAAIDGCKEFEVYYQPIIDIQSGDACIGAEALIRWNSEEMGFMSPVDFIPLAEYLGLINPIGGFVLEQACETCRGWNEKGYPDYKVNVNLSVVQLLQADIVESVEKTLKATKLNPKNLTLEVTEGLAINDLERMKQILFRIKELGVKIALDDFGTGYSSLSHIRELPFDVIKVDQSFVKDLADDAYSKAFIRMVADLADAIDVSVCVEGIETKEQCEVLKGMNVKMIQGYYFGKPLTRKEFEKKYVK